MTLNYLGVRSRILLRAAVRSFLNRSRVARLFLFSARFVQFVFGDGGISGGAPFISFVFFRVLPVLIFFH